MNIAWKQSRYDKGEGDDYINCPLSKEQYYQFINAIKDAPKMEFKEFEKTPFFEGCMPIEEIVRRGDETLRFGPMKPVGLTNPHKDEEPYAIVQLRQDNKSGSLYNIVGFQTKMKHGSQKDVFRTSKRCMSCNARKNNKRKVVNRPSLETILNDIKETI